MSNPKLKPCRKCGSRNLKQWDCGYSSFNVGGIKCLDCKHEVKLDTCSCFPDGELARAWNADAPDVEEQLRAENKRLKATVRRLRREIKENESRNL